MNLEGTTHLHGLQPTPGQAEVASQGDSRPANPHPRPQMPHVHMEMRFVVLAVVIVNHLYDDVIEPA